MIYNVFFSFSLDLSNLSFLSNFAHLLHLLKTWGRKSRYRSPPCSNVTPCTQTLPQNAEQSFVQQTRQSNDNNYNAKKIACITYIHLNDNQHQNIPHSTTSPFLPDTTDHHTNFTKYGEQCNSTHEHIQQELKHKPHNNIQQPSYNQSKFTKARTATIKSAHHFPVLLGGATIDARKGIMDAQTKERLPPPHPMSTMLHNSRHLTTTLGFEQQNLLPLLYPTTLFKEDWVGQELHKMHSQ